MKKKCCFNVESDNDEDDYGVGSSPFESDYKELKVEEKEGKNVNKKSR